MITAGSEETPLIRTSMIVGWLLPVSIWFILITTSSVAATPRVELVRYQKVFGVSPVYKCPRPAPDEIDVPLQTSLFFQLVLRDSSKEDTVIPDSVTAILTPENGKSLYMLKEGSQFAPGFSGWLVPSSSVDHKQSPALSVYISLEQPLASATVYTVQVAAASGEGAVLKAEEGHWSFTTEDPAEIQPVEFSLSLRTKPVSWHGAFFQGFLKPDFCGSHYHGRIDGYQLMYELHKRHPKAWRLQRDFWLVGDVEPERDWIHSLPGLVHERETRRIWKMEKHENEVLLCLQDFFGHRQYGIESNRALSLDYSPGDIILIADGKNHATAEVKGIDDEESTILVSSFPNPDEGWGIGYTGPLPEKENPDKPGLFPPGGCYLRKFRPAGTPCYYWGRVDKEWDLVRGFNRRLVVNFDVPTELSVSGRAWDTAKDYVELHEVVRTISDRLIKRYGDDCLDFVWSVFNEPDLRGFFWHSTWDELQKCYDYTVDGILRAFEDNGYDSNQVFVGGLELGAIAGTHLEDREFLIHCSPEAEGEGALPLNAAYADPRLDGKRSRRVEELCSKHNGRGSPCDFISVHCYETSKTMSAKLIQAKKDALEIDPDYYSDLWVCSHESCPGWRPSPGDPAWYDSYRGNGYFSTWAADVIRRLLQKANEDACYAYGETILTFWPWPDAGMNGLNACTTVVSMDINEDGKPDKKVTVKKQIFNFIELLASMADDYLVLPEVDKAGYVVSGFATQTDKDIRLLIYAHKEIDTQSSSDDTFDVTIKLDDLSCERLIVRQYQMDKGHNSCFRLAREKLGTRVLFPLENRELVFTPQEVARIEKAAHLHETAPRMECGVQNGKLELMVELTGNGLNFLVLESTEIRK
jgi:hypothetical protein